MQSNLPTLRNFMEAVDENAAPAEGDLTYIVTRSPQDGDAYATRCLDPDGPAVAIRLVSEFRGEAIETWIH